MMSGDLPPAYLVFTTGNGFAPNIEGIPQAMKGLGTMFMLALVTGIYINLIFFLRISSNSDDLYQSINSAFTTVWFFNSKPLHFKVWVDP